MYVLEIDGKAKSNERFKNLGKFDVLISE